MGVSGQCALQQGDSEETDGVQSSRATAMCDLGHTVRIEYPYDSAVQRGVCFSRSSSLLGQCHTIGTGEQNFSDGTPPVVLGILVQHPGSYGCGLFLSYVLAYRSSAAAQQPWARF